MLSLVPSETAVVVKTRNLNDLVQQLQQNSFLRANHTLPIVQYFEAVYEPIKKLNLSDKSLLCFSRVGRTKVAATLITPIESDLLQKIGYEKIKGFTYNGTEIKTYQLDRKALYGAKLNNFFVFGTSKLVVENMVRLSADQLISDEELKKLYTSEDAKNTAVFVNVPQFQRVFSALLPRASTVFSKYFSGWVALDALVQNNRFHVDGVTLPEKDEILGILKGTNPQSNKLAEITPLSARGFYSYTYDDFEKIKKNLSFYRKENYPKLEVDLLSASVEIGKIFNREGAVFVLRSKKAATMATDLKPFSQLIDTHRNYKVYAFSKSNYFYKALRPLVSIRHLKFYTQINQFFVFAKSRSALENIIDNYQNKTVLAQREAYRNMTDKLDEKSSLLLVGITKNMLSYLTKNASEKYEEATKKAKSAAYKYAALQFINHDNFTYVNGLLTTVESEHTPQGGLQIESIRLKEKIAAGPWFFINWRTRHYDIVVQGESNKLYVYDENGKLRWEKQLDGRILGGIQPIDIYQNHRIQMAFVTPHTFFIIDREGNVVKPFNESFKAPITQPLALFDYAQNGRFRFVITQGDKLTMLDKHLKPVKGFEFASTKSPVLHAPKHYRIGNKDYIIVAEESGKLHILNPRGQTRVPVKEKIDFSDNDWYVYNKQFTSTDKKGQLVQISQQGKIHKKDLGLTPENKMYATPHTLVTFSDNKLTIKGTEISLDYGLYTAPKIFYIKDKLYITITDTQAHKVYLFDSKAKLFSGFPVYGNSTIDLKNMNNHGGLELLVRGDEDTILVYEVE